ncbi:BA75_00151T0 [Komagataella pastoris]|uniref:2,5-diamino-6-ribosylamino-4(3H)-pyrimidinone 5'-phosphate reductase n=1 Tax=Komagataella pastoris TaxID=4922 RepID=A0A1B2J7M9_PICPA|nr:BA75_00151T0 [Komagataella pastoris]
MSFVPFLEPFIPHENTLLPELPFVTLTYAQSLDSRIAAKKGERTVISHQETKDMTQYLRSKHDAILVGVKTVLADDPGLNCKLGTPIRPIVLDPTFQLRSKIPSLKLIKLGLSGEGEPPVFITRKGVVSPDLQANIRSEYGISIVEIADRDIHRGKMSWFAILKILKDAEIHSVMVEGGATIINDLLICRQNSVPLVASLIITVGPVYLGKDGVEVTPARSVKLGNVRWWHGIQDAVVAANLE